MAQDLLVFRVPVSALAHQTEARLITVEVGDRPTIAVTVVTTTMAAPKGVATGTMLPI